MSDQARPSALDTPAVASTGTAIPFGWRRLLSCAGTAMRLGPRPVGLWVLHRAALATGWPARLLRDQAVPQGAFLPADIPAPPILDPGVTARVIAAARAVDPSPDWHGGREASLPALDVPLRDIRPVWEASWLAALPLLAQAARLDPGGGHLARAEALLRGWCAANPPFRGANWACGQEAALRALHLALALALLDADRAPPPASRALLALCAGRIDATPMYALAQDNNHPVSEAAGAYACALLLGRPVARHGAALAARVARVVAPDGGFAQVSPGYARLLLDVVSIAEWLRRRHGAPALPAVLAARAAALARWLHNLTDPATGATPPLGLEDGSAFADLGLHGPHDARGSVERALRLFAGAGGDAPQDAGCAWLDVGPAPPAPRPARWQVAGTRGWAAGGGRAVLRTGPLRFRPGQADLLHLSLHAADDWLLRDGGTGSYDPPAAWWWHALAGARAHNAAVFDGREPMPRLGRFLLGGWPRATPLSDGAAMQDRHGHRQARRVSVEGRVWTIEDRFRGRFGHVALHWRLRPAAWQLIESGVASPHARITIAADATPRLTLRQGFESRAYGRIAPVPLLVVEANAPVSTIVTRIHLPPLRSD